MNRPADCEHLTFTMRRRVTTNGSTMIGNQCNKCGGQCGTWISHHKVREPDLLPMWDDRIAEFWRAEQSRLRGEYRAQAVRNIGVQAFASRETDRRPPNFFAVYDEYLKSDAWRQKRALVMARAHGVCEGCATRKATQVHHLDYRRVGREMLFDLVAICDICHEAVHGHHEQQQDRAA